MMNTWLTVLEACNDSSLESHWDDADVDDAREFWTKPWDLPDVPNCADYSNTSRDHPGHRDMIASSTADMQLPTENLHSK